jgi:hypothetical protein
VRLFSDPPTLAERLLVWSLASAAGVVVLDLGVRLVW